MPPVSNDHIPCIAQASCNSTMYMVWPMLCRLEEHTWCLEEEWWWFSCRSYISIGLIVMRTTMRATCTPTDVMTIMNSTVTNLSSSGGAIWFDQSCTKILNFRLKIFKKITNFTKIVNFCNIFIRIVNFLLRFLQKILNFRLKIFRVVQYGAMCDVILDVMLCAPWFCTTHSHRRYYYS